MGTWGILLEKNKKITLKWRKMGRHVEMWEKFQSTKQKWSEEGHEVTIKRNYYSYYSYFKVVDEINLVAGWSASLSNWKKVITILLVSELLDEWPTKNIRDLSQWTYFEKVHI